MNHSSSGSNDSSKQQQSPAAFPKSESRSDVNRSDSGTKLNTIRSKSNLQVLLPKHYHGSSESLNATIPKSPVHSLHSPAGGSPYIHYDEMTEKHFLDTPGSDKSGALTRKESYKAQRKSYRQEKKRVATELHSALKDPSVTVLADWLKVRGTLKSWTKLWCVLKPGLLYIYKSPKAKSTHWVGTLLLNTCEVIERPSKKDGFCFKLFHPLEQSIWATKGPEGETLGAVVQPLPTAYLIFRAPSQAAGKCWMDALELVLRCSSFLMRSVNKSGTGTTPISSEDIGLMMDFERHFKDHDLDDNISHNEKDIEHLHEHSLSETETDDDSVHGGEEDEQDEPEEVESPDPVETEYCENGEEEFGGVGEQTEELAEENRSLLWFLVKQVRPGMDLSKVVLPTFILEPRSFLDKLTDYHYHADLLTEAVLEDDAFTRMKTIVRWYLSGFYKKPKGLKKPYNPVLGETFRCFWKHPSGSRTFYVAEQVSHHPPISAFYITNRNEGFAVSGSILAKSRFYGNATSAILDGNAKLTLLPRGEDYVVNMPYAYCKGILLGTLTMELGGKVDIQCEKTGYKTELEFRLKPFLGGAEITNGIAGKIRLGKEILATIDGHWDSEIYIKDKRTGETQLLWNASPEIRGKRLKRYTVPLEHQGDYESERLWQHVTLAIRREDQHSATEEKTILEEAQRNSVKERKAKCIEWVPKFFEQDRLTGSYVYKYADVRPWDPRNDVFQYEHNYAICTKTKHKTPVIRTSSLISMEPQADVWTSSSKGAAIVKSRNKKKRNNQSGSSSPEADIRNSDSSHSDQDTLALNMDPKTIQDIIRPIEKMQAEALTQILSIKEQVESLKRHKFSDDIDASRTKDLILLFLILGVYHFLIYTLYLKQ